MAKALFVAYLVTLSISSIAGYSTDCAIGPEYWCQSFKNADDCVAIQHCTDTVWRSNNELALADSSSDCKWCRRILATAHSRIGNLVEDEDSIMSSLASGCQLFSSTETANKCTNMFNQYKSSFSSLIKHKRYATLCRLMSVCTNKLTTEKSPVVLGQHQCTWGPSYWCSSLSNSRECNSVNHCSNQIWSQQAIQKKANDYICQYCEYIIGKLRTFILNKTTEINVEKWLSDACSTLQNKEWINKCVGTMSQYAKEIVVLIENNVDPGIICHLGEMCKDATIVVRNQIAEPQSEEKDISSVDEQSHMLCNILVRATYELHVNQKKGTEEIKVFLKTDCQHLLTMELIEKCQNLVDQHGKDIYDQVAKNKDLSDICHYSPSSVDSTAVQSVSQTRCDLCTFVLTAAGSMMDAKRSDDEVLAYINKHFCSQMTNEAKEQCELTVESYEEELIEGIQQRKQPILLCTYFETCLDKFGEEKSPVQKDEMRSFLRDSLCNHLGPFEESCHALMEQDTNRLLKTLVNDVDGDVLCQIFGMCPTQMSFLDNLAAKDDTDKCKRCTDDFTRRKHIAEKLLNHSTEFLHHFCSQLPQKDECTKAVDESINKVVEFIRGLDPREICVELKECDQASLKTIQQLQISTSDNILSQQVIKYIKTDVCRKLGSLSALCDSLLDSEGANLFAAISKKVCPHKVCSIFDVCPKTTAFDNCNDKCECCVSKMENYQVRLASFLNTMVATTNALCKRMTHSTDCLRVASYFESDVKALTTRYDAKQICQSLTHCATDTSKECDTSSDKCTCCQNQFNNRQENFQTVVDKIMENHRSLCTDDNCRTLVRSNQQEILYHIAAINTLTYCQRSGVCRSSSGQRSIPFITDLLANMESTVPAINNPCTSFGSSKTMCEHLLVSKQSARYMKVYIALLTGDANHIGEDFKNQQTSTCDACKNAVQSSKDFWTNALGSLRDTLLQACDRCPSKDQCQKYINQRYDILKSYVDKIDPEQFCQSIRLCSAVTATNVCSTCINRLQLRKDAASQAVDRLAGYFNDQCQRFAQKQCQIYVKEVHDSIQKSIEEFDPKATCTVIGFCESMGNELEMNFVERELSLQADIEQNICSKLGPFETLCKSVIQGDSKQIQALKLDYDIKEVMRIGDDLHDLLETDDFGKFPISKKDYRTGYFDLDESSDDKCQCCIRRIMRRKRAVRFIGDAVFFSLIRSCHRCPAKHLCRRYWLVAKARFDCRISRIDPKRVCTHFGLCNTTSVYGHKGENAPEKCDDTAPVETPQIDLSNSTCILCEYAMNILSNYINRQSTEEEIEQSLQKICSQMPSTLQNPCLEYIDNYGPSIIATLMRRFDLSTLCRRLNLCTSQMQFDLTDITKADTTTCGVCNYLSTYLHSALKRDSNEQALQQALGSVCSYVSDELKTRCQTILQLYSPYIHRLELSPKNSFCKQLTICEMPMLDLEPAIRVNEANEISTSAKTPTTKEHPHLNPQCSLCQYIISYLDAIMKNNKSEQAFEDALKKVCKILPSKFLAKSENCTSMIYISIRGKEASQCEEFVKTYGPTLAQLIAEMADPKVVCQYLNMCPESSVRESPTLPTEIAHDLTPYTCTICQFIVSRIKRFIATDQDTNQAITATKESCDLFNAENLKTQCKAFVDQHGSYFLHIVSNDILPRSACLSMKVCPITYPITSTSVAPISTSTTQNKCAFSQKMWCLTRAIAKSCDAEEYCEREVWTKGQLFIEN
ncbi:unnamed protein product [Adineta ricciae]|uniref:Proactivator polypeptide n=1 Tax=Adineta ricciae TaxID=249248 RepID=A0A815F2P2_ADIRI|nr:unnamed protein product [Adineta ricciae]